MIPHIETQTLNADSKPADVFAVLTDVARIPEWAPDFAESVAHEGGDDWLARKGERSFAIRSAVNPASFTVDYIRTLPSGGEGGAYLRVLPRAGGGSVIVMTIQAPLSGPREGLIETMQRELTGLVQLAGSGASRD